LSAPQVSAPQLLEQLVAALRKLSPQSRIVQATEARNQLVGLIDEARSEIDHQPRKIAKTIKPRKAVAVEAPAAVQ
jgi:low affinity Fe/Cu permease